MTIDVAAADEAVGILEPGDLVAVYAITKSGAARSVVNPAKVVAVGPDRVVHGPKDVAVPSTVLGLDVPLADAARIKEAQSQGQLTVFVLGGDAAKAAAAAS